MAKKRKTAERKTGSGKRGVVLLRLAGLLLEVLLPLMAMHADAVTTTTVQGTVFRADGSTATGMLIVSWPAFTTMSNDAIAAGSVTATIGANGSVSLNLAPNAGALPAGTYYTAVYHLNDGTVNKEYWVVPTTASATIAQVRAMLMPATVAIQTVSKQYVDAAVAGVSGNYLPVNGGTLTGPLALANDPSSSMQASTKHYTDAQVSNIANAALPKAGGSMTGPLAAPSVVASVNSTIYVKAAPYNAKCDGQSFSDGAVSSNNLSTLTSASANFVSTDVGKYVEIQTEGVNSSYALVTTITKVLDAHDVFLADPARAAGTSLKWLYITDDTSAFMAAKAAVDALPSAAWPYIELPAGVCMAAVTGWKGESFVGKGPSNTTWLTKPGMDALVTDSTSGLPSNNQTVRDITFLVDSSINVSSATLLSPGSLPGSGTFSQRVSGTNGGLNLYGQIATSSGNPIELPVGGVINSSNGLRYGGVYTSAPTVVVTGGGCTTEPVFTATLTGTAVSALTLVSQSAGCQTPPAVSFTGGGVTNQASVSLFLNAPAIVPDSANGGFEAPPWYVGNCGIAVARPSSTFGPTPNGFVFAHLNFSVVNGPNRANNTCAMLMQGGDYSTVYRDITIRQLYYGIVFAPYYTNAQDGIYAPDTDVFDNVSVYNAVWPLTFYNGNLTTFRNVSTYGESSNQHGAMILGFPSGGLLAPRNAPAGAIFQNYYYECSNTNSGEMMRISGNNHLFHRGTAGSCNVNNGYWTIFGNNGDYSNGWGFGSATSGPTLHVYGNGNNFGLFSTNISGFNQQSNLYQQFGFANTFRWKTAFTGAYNVTDVYTNRVRQALGGFDGGYAVSHGSAPFTSLHDLVWTCEEQSSGAGLPLDGNCIQDPLYTENSGIYWNQPVQFSSSGGNIILGGSSQVRGLFVGDRVPQGPVTLHVMARIVDANGNVAPQRTTWQTASGSSTLGNIYYRVTQVVGGNETPAGPETLAVGGTNQNVQINSPINCAQPGATGWNLYAGTTSGSEQLQNGSTPIACGTNFVFSTVPAITGTPVTNFTASQTWNLISQPDNLNRGNQSVVYAGYWQDLTINADLTSAPIGAYVQYRSTMFGGATATVSAVQIASVSVEPGLSPNILISNKQVSGLSQGSPIDHGALLYPSGMKPTSFASDSTAKWTLENFTAPSPGAAGVASYNGVNMTLDNAMWPQGPVLIEWNVKTASSNTNTVFKLVCNGVTLGQSVNLTTSYTTVYMPFDLSSCPLGSAVSFNWNNPTTNQPVTTGSLVIHSMNLNNQPQVAADPASPAKGQSWFNTTGNQLKYYNGTSTLVLGGGTVNNSSTAGCVSYYPAAGNTVGCDAGLTDNTGTGQLTYSGALGYAGVGTLLTNLNASNLGSGTVSAARLPASVVPLAGTTGALPAAAIAAGACVNLTATVTGASSAMVVHASPNSTTQLIAGLHWDTAYVSAAGTGAVPATVTVPVCNTTAAAITPNVTPVFNVRVVP